jgi:hypothetical protein
MKRILAPILLLTLLVGTPAFSGEFIKGLTAYKSGDYATALWEWTPLVSFPPKTGPLFLETEEGCYGSETSFRRGHT